MRLVLADGSWVLIFSGPKERRMGGWFAMRRPSVGRLSMRGPAVWGLSVRRLAVRRFAMRRLAWAVVGTTEEGRPVTERRVWMAAIAVGMVTMRVFPPRRRKGVVPMSIVPMGVISMRMFPPGRRERVIAVCVVPVSPVASLSRPTISSGVAETDDTVEKSLQRAPESVTVRFLQSLLDFLLAVGQLLQEHLLELNLTFQLQGHIPKELQIGNVFSQIGCHFFPGKDRVHRAIVDLIVAVGHVSENGRPSNIKDLDRCSR